MNIDVKTPNKTLTIPIKWASLQECSEYSHTYTNKCNSSVRGTLSVLEVLAEQYTREGNNAM